MQVSLSIKDAATACGLSRRYVAELIAKGELPSVKVGGRRLVLTEDLRKFLTDRRSQ